jgi:Phage integrase, N-terminal SAM-like domain
LTGPGHWSLGSIAWRFHRGFPLSTSTALATRDELFSANDQLALAGFLAGYSGLTREAHTLDLRQYVAWCTERRVAVFGARRADIECFARHLESLGRARATIARRLCTGACFYRYAEQEGLIAVSRRPMCVDPAWTTSPTPPAWTATRSAPCWWPPGWAVAGITR